MGDHHPKYPSPTHPLFVVFYFPATIPHSYFLHLGFRKQRRQNISFLFLLLSFFGRGGRWHLILFVF